MGIRLFSAVAISTVIMGTATAFANPLFDELHQRHSAPPPYQMHECSPCMTGPEIATREKIEQMIDEEREKMEPAFRKLHESQKKTRKLAMQKPFNEAAVRLAASEMAKAETELLVSRLRTQSRIAELLEAAAEKHSKK